MTKDDKKAAAFSPAASEADAAPATPVVGAPSRDAECCGNCSAFNQLSAMKGFGQCRFNPPTVMINGLVQQVGPITGQPLTRGLIDTFFPLVNPNMWCRQFARRLSVIGMDLKPDTPAGEKQ